MRRDRSAHQVITRAIGGTVAVKAHRDHVEGSETFGVIYESRGSQWTSAQRFPDENQALAGAIVLADFLGAEVRR